MDLALQSPDGKQDFNGKEQSMAVWKKLIAGSALSCLALLAACSGGSNSADNWTNYGNDGREQHFAAFDEINTGNVANLKLAWASEVEPGFTVSGPVEANGKLFVTTGHSHIRAFEAKSGKLLWEYDAKTREIAQSPLHMSFGNRGLAWEDGRVFISTTDGRVIALDDSTGKPIWEARDFPTTDLRNSNGPPRVFDGKVIVGHGGADISPIQGYVSAYDAKTGKLVWRFHTVPGDPSKPAENKAEEVMRSTWKGDWFGADGQRRGGGGTAWNAFSYDAELGLIYLGVGNGFPYNQKMRSPGGGDNLFLASIVAVKADTGEYVWHYQVCPGEQMDCTAVQDMTLADVEIGGKPRKVLMQAPKNGFFYVVDRATGEFISAEKIAKVTWAERIDEKGRPVENPAYRYNGKPGLFELWPGPQGAHSWQPQAFSPQTGLIYIPVIEIGAMIGDKQPGGLTLGGNNGVTLLSDAPLPGSRRSFLKAWNPATQKEAWNVELPGVWPGGILATAGGLVFQGRIDGNLVAYDAKTGKEVWTFKTPSPIVAPPISYRVGGKQYITVLTGSGSQGGGIMASGNAAWRTDYRLPRHVLTFVLDGKASLPAFTMPELIPAVAPGFRPDPAMAQKGGMAFAMGACIVCHGMNAIGGGAAPDLRYSQMILDGDAFRKVVKEGALKLQGMPVSPQIADADLEAMRHYLQIRAMQAPGEAAALKAGLKSKAPTPQQNPHGS
jgi:quinohemoprotein ethanol dehydrogenase